MGTVEWDFDDDIEYPRIAVETKRSGLTVIEILVVVGIIAALVGLLLPAVHMVQKTARETKQKAQFTAIELGLAAFKNDYGDYPPSHWFDPSGRTPGTRQDYCGAQKLAEAMLGWDLLGFHPQSAWRADGRDASGTAGTVYEDTTTTDLTNLRKRKARYVEMQTANPFRLGGTYGLFPSGTGLLNPDRYVLCDVFGVSGRKITQSDGRVVTPGTPILYYRANPANLIHVPTAQTQTSAAIYDIRDNVELVNLGTVGGGKEHWLTPGHFGASAPLAYFYNYIRDPRITARDWPHRPDSYILISAGMDGIYGTDDDIRNFGQ